MLRSAGSSRTSRLKRIIVRPLLILEVSGAHNGPGDRQNRRLQTIEALVQSRKVSWTNPTPLPYMSLAATSQVIPDKQLLQNPRQLSPSLASREVWRSRPVAEFIRSGLSSQSQLQALMSTTISRCLFYQERRGSNLYFEVPACKSRLATDRSIDTVPPSSMDKYIPLAHPPAETDSRYLIGPAYDRRR